MKTGCVDGCLSDSCVFVREKTGSCYEELQDQVCLSVCVCVCVLPCKCMWSVCALISVGSSYLQYSMLEFVSSIVLNPGSGVQLVLLTQISLLNYIPSQL